MQQPGAPTVQIKSKVVTLQGKLSPAEVEKTVIASEEAIRSVCEQKAARESKLGVITIEFEIDGSGRVLNVNISEDQFKNQRLSETFVRVMKRLRFKAPDDRRPMKVKYCFELKAE